MRILVVEDDLPLRKVITELFEEESYQVDGTDSGDALAHKVNRVVAIRDGQTSLEMIRREVAEPNSFKSENEPQASQDRHEEYIVLDRAGRLQVPKAYLDALQIRCKASMEFDGE